MIANPDSVTLFLSICDILKGERLISDKTLTDLNNCLQSLVLDDNLKSKILSYFDNLHRTVCKSWLLLVFVRFPLPEIYNLWQFLFTNEVLPPVCLEVLLKDSLLETKTSWFSSTILLRRTISKRDSTRLKQFYDLINGLERLIEKLKRNSDLTTCFNLLKFVKDNEFSFQPFDLNKRVLFINSFNPVFNNLYQLNGIACKNVKDLNSHFPSMIFVQVVDNAMIIWINSNDFVIDLGNLSDVSTLDEGRMKLIFKRTNGSNRVTLIGTTTRNLEIELTLKRSNQHLSLQEKLKYQPMRPRRVSVALIPFDLKENLLSGSKPLAAKNPTSQLAKRTREMLELDLSEDTVSPPLKTRNTNPQVHARIPRKVEFQVKDSDSDELTNYSYDGSLELDSLWTTQREKPKEPPKTQGSSQIKVFKKRNSIIGNTSDEVSDSEDSNSIQVAQSSQIPPILTQMEVPETQDRLSPSVSPLAHGTSTSSIKLSKVDSSKYDIIQENLSNLNNSLVEKMKSFENEILNKQNELNNELEEKFNEILANHNENLYKLNEFIDLKKSQIFNITD